MYEMKHDDDHEYAARALIRALDPVDKITAWELKNQGAEHPIVKQIVRDHGLKNYHKKLAKLKLADMPNSGGKRLATQDVEGGGAAKRQKMD